jgi:TrmH family RNA methyltransferase
MLSNNKLRFIISLQRKKIRDEEMLFVIEGDKIVKEFLGSEMKIVTLVAKPEFIGGLTDDQMKSIDEVIPVSYDELKRVSRLKTPHNAMAVVKIPGNKEPETIDKGELIAALDFIQDPGNLGTIIRAAAWFGIKKIICSENCVDVYNSKVVQATMGAILNVKVHYTDLKNWLTLVNKKGFPIYGTMLEGVSIYGIDLKQEGVILLGNESRGISDELLPLITSNITIPKFTNASRGIESLNAGMAAAIVFSEFARRKNGTIQE